MQWIELVGYGFIVLGLLAMFLGLFGVLRFSTFTMRVLASAKIDIVACILILIGVAIVSQSGWFAAKVGLILLIVLFASPITSAQTLSRARQDGEL
jgi:multicomponent Na+:H+ antiporter subunit G